EAMAQIVQGNLHCVIFNFDNFGATQVALIHGIRQVAKVFQVLIFADTIEEESARIVRELEALAIIEKPLLDLNNDVQGLCTRLIEGAENTLRESKRHSTSQKASVHHVSNNRNYSGVVRNISEKGACIEVTTNSLRVGDVVKITIDLDRLNRARIIVG